MKALHFLLAALFLYMAALQFNDPDPLYWIVVYAGTALVALGKGIGRSSDFLAAMVLGGVLAGMMIAAPALPDYFSSGNPGSIFGDMRGAGYIEPTREFFGLGIALAALVFYVKR